MSTNVTIVGNLTADPEMRFTPSGHAVANFTVAVTERVKDGNEWKDGPSSFYRCAIWRQYAENLTESLTKGTRVIVTGRMKQREYETNTGEKRSVWEVEADEVGPALKYATAKVTKAQRAASGFGNAGSDPWTAPAPTPASSDEIPF